RGRSKLLEYDPARRALFQDSFTVRKGEPMNLHAVYYALTPQREARTVSLTLEPPARTLAATPGLGIRKDIRIADEGLAAGVRYRLRNDGDEAIELSFTSASNLGLLGENEAADVITVGTRKTTAGKPIEVRNVTEVQVHSESKHFDLTLAIDPPALVITKPIYAVTNSDRKSTRLNSSHVSISYAVFCLKKKKNKHNNHEPPNISLIFSHFLTPLYESMYV